MSKSVERLAEELADLRKEMRDLEKQKTALGKKAEEIEKELIAELDAMGTDMSRFPDAGITVSISEQVVPQVVDWDKLERWIYRNHALYLLQRRPSVTAFRELMEARKRPIPGLEAFTKRKININTSKRK